MSRDVYRGLLIHNLSFSDWLGPEIGYGVKRLPGIFYSLLLSVFLPFKSLAFLLVAKTSIAFSCYFYLWLKAKDVYGIKITTLWWLIFVTNPLVFVTTRNLWNPSLIMSFSAVALAVYFKSLMKKLQNRDYFILSLLLFFAIQVHFSAIVGISVVMIALFFNGNNVNWKKNAFCFLPVILLLLFWHFFQNNSQAFVKQVSDTYGNDQLSFSWIWKRLTQLSYHFTHNVSGIPDYDLFSIITSKFYTILSVEWLNVFYIFRTSLSIFGNILICFSIIPLSFVVIKAEGNNRKLLIFSVSWFLLVFSIVTLFDGKDVIPYRYGQMLYPIQFILMIVPFYVFLSKPKIKIYMNLFLVSFVSITVLYNLTFNVLFLLTMKKTGLSYHGVENVYELNLFEKQKIMSNIPFNEELMRRDYGPFHGRIVNRIRLHEHNWDLTSYFGAIGLTSTKPQNIRVDTFVFYNEKNHSVDLMAMEAFQKATFIKGTLLTQNEDLINITNGINEFMPYEFVENYHQAKKINLHYRISSRNQNVCIDYDGFQPIKIYKDVNVLLNDKLLNVSFSHPGFWLTQSKKCFSIENVSSLSDVDIFVELEVERTDVGKFNRIDVYGIDDEFLKKDIFF